MKRTFTFELSNMLGTQIKAGAAEGFYGPIEKEAAIAVDEQLKAFLIGKDALEQEKLRDQMYRSNRHARRGHFLLAISAIDNTLWDLRGRYFKTRLPPARRPCTSTGATGTSTES